MQRPMDFWETLNALAMAFVLLLCVLKGFFFLLYVFEILTGWGPR